MNVFDMALYGKIKGGGGGSSNLGTKTVNANGVYNASSDNLDGYSKVTVDVDNTYSAGDEGKVVKNGALASQTSATYSSAGTYDTTEINSVTVDVPVYYLSPDSGTIYQKIMDINITSFTNEKMGVNRYPYCPELEELTIRGMTSVSNTNNYVAKKCDKLRKVCFPELVGNDSSYMVINCTALVDIQIGSVGHAKNATIYGNAFSGCTNSDLVITIYVADDATLPYANSPWGATNATVVYRSATTGEVITV